MQVERITHDVDHDGNQIVNARFLGLASEDAGTSNLLAMSEYTRESTGTAAVGFGIGHEWKLDDDAGTLVSAAHMQVLWRDASAAKPKAAITFRTSPFDFNELIVFNHTDDDILFVNVPIESDGADDERGILLRGQAGTSVFGASIKIFGTQTEGTPSINGVRYRANQHQFYGIGTSTEGVAVRINSQLVVHDAAGTNIAHLDLTDGDSAPVSLANEGRIRYDKVTDKIQISENTGAWTDIGGGGGTFSGSIAADQIAHGTAVDTLGGISDLKWVRALTDRSFQVNSNPTKVSAAGSDWDAAKFTGVMTLTGGTNVTAISLVRIKQGDITSASGTVITDAASLTIDGPPTNSGSVTFTNEWALRIVAGNALFGGTLQTTGIGTKDLVSYAVGVVDTGMFANGSGDLHLSHTGTDIFEVIKTGVRLVLNGTAALPSIGWQQDPNTGFYLTGASSDDIGHTGGGVVRAIMSSGAVPGAETGGWRVRDGSASEPSYSWINDPDSGFYWVQANRIAVALNGNSSYIFKTTGFEIVGSKQLHAAVGTLAAPSISFASDSNCGLFRFAGDSIKAVAGGVECIHWAEVASASLVGFHGTAAVIKQTISGSSEGNAAVQSIAAALATIGLFIDTTT